MRTVPERFNLSWKAAIATGTGSALNADSAQVPAEDRAEVAGAILRLASVEETARTILQPRRAARRPSEPYGRWLSQ
jgi:hypothetical protein